MNRDIKFRVWDKFQKKFLDYPCYFNNKDFNEFAACDRYFKCDEEGCIAQQYTGLKDKNGREIYEGDILKVKSYDGWHDEIGYYYNAQVFYCFRFAKFRYSFKNIDNIKGVDFTLEDDIEVIGNIFENKSLLTENPELLSAK